LEESCPKHEAGIVAFGTNLRRTGSFQRATGEVDQLELTKESRFAKEVVQRAWWREHGGMRSGGSPASREHVEEVLRMGRGTW
jgi:hypothetical protein